MARYVFVCPDEFLWEIVSPAALAGDAPLFVVEKPAVRSRIARQGGQALAGKLDQEGVYRRAFRSGHEQVVVAVDPGRRQRVVAAIRSIAPAATILALSGDPSRDASAIPTVSTAEFVDRVIEPELARAVTRARVERLRRHFERADRVLILVQDEPDPDAIASAVALRALLARNKTAAPIATFGTITRPENRAMTRILEIDVETIKPAEADEFELMAIVDAQPAFFEERLPEPTLVIDHHPEEVPVRARFKDIRPGYGATSTILTEYLRAGDAKFGHRLATALLYGIKADTLGLERGATKADMEAYAFLHGYANHSALRRIERPELPEAALDILARGIARRHVAGGAVFSHLGAVAYSELVPQFADFFLQVEGVEWSVVSGIVNGALHVSVRNVGYVRGAGEVVRQAFGDLGSAGGHRSMAKAVIRLRDWKAHEGDLDDERVARAIVGRFQRALRG